MKKTISTIFKEYARYYWIPTRLQGEGTAVEALDRIFPDATGRCAEARVGRILLLLVVRVNGPGSTISSVAGHNLTSFS